MWQIVSDSGIIPGWNKDLLPEEEKEIDCRPPTPPTQDLSLIYYVQTLEEEKNKLPKIKKIIKDKQEIFEKDLHSRDEVVLLSGSYIVRTTKAGVGKSKRDREEEESEFRGRTGMSIRDRISKDWSSRSGFLGRGQDSFKQHDKPVL